MDLNGNGVCGRQIPVPASVKLSRTQVGGSLLLVIHLLAGSRITSLSLNDFISGMALCNDFTAGKQGQELQVYYIMALLLVRG